MGRVAELDHACMEERGCCGGLVKEEEVEEEEEEEEEDNDDDDGVASIKHRALPSTLSPDQGLCSITINATLAWGIPAKPLAPIQLLQAVERQVVQLLPEARSRGFRAIPPDSDSSRPWAELQHPMSTRPSQSQDERRGAPAATAAAAAAAEPPPAPPLPPQPSSARAAAIALARFAQNIHYGPSTSTTPQHHLRKLPAAGQALQGRSRLDEIFPSSRESPLQVPRFGPPRKSPLVPLEVDQTPANRIRSPVAPVNISHKTGIPIAALDISPCRTRAVLAGRDILKTLAVTGSSCTEDYNLREKFLRYASTRETPAGAVSAKHKDQLAANDVKWSHSDWHTTIATAAANGQIVVYDLNRADLVFIRLQEHNRQVHRLGFNPHRGSLLLSGSQDATTKLWDLRAFTKERGAMTCHTVGTYAGHSEAVRDLQWSPTNGVEFAVGTDSGSVQYWDIRKTKSPILKVTAHEKTCNSVHWHPDGKHLASGSSDKTVKVWDFSSPDSRMKPLWQLRTPQAALHVRWRPASWSSEGHGPGQWHCTQLAVSYDKEDPRVHIWDLRRPSIPFRLLSRYETHPAALLWHSEDLLWSVDSEGMFMQSDLRFAQETVAGYNVNPIDIAPDGQMLLASMKRESKRLSLDDVTDTLLSIKRREASRSGEASEGQNNTPESHEEPRLLNASLGTRRSKPPSLLKPTRSMDTTPPAEPSPGPEDTVLPLDQSLQKKHMYMNPQALGIGYIHGLVDTDAFQFMARHYIAPPEVSIGEQGCNLHLILSKTFMHNATVAKFAGKHRLAQTWKILAQAVESELGNRAERNYQLRMAAVASEEAPKQSSNTATKPLCEDVTGNGNHVPAEMTKPAPNRASPIISQTQSYSATPPATHANRALVGVESIVATHQHPQAHLRESDKGKQRDLTAADLFNPGNLNSFGQKEDIEKETLIQVESVSTSKGYHDQVKPKAQSTSREASPDEGLIELDRQIAERRLAAVNCRPQPEPVLDLDDLFSRLEGKKLSELSSYERKHAESLMAFHDDEIKMVNASHWPDPSDSTLDQDKGKFRNPAQVPDPSMPSAECIKQAEPLINQQDMHPLKGWVTPLTKVKVTDDHIYIESDFRETSHEAGDEPQFPPWTASAMFIPLIEYHCSLSDAQLPTYLLLHLAPWLSVSLPPMRALRIVVTYHHQLTQFELYKEATELRTYCETEFPFVTSLGLEGVNTVGPWCTNCRKISKGRQQEYCERCKTSWVGCSICHDTEAILGLRSTRKKSSKFPQATYPTASDELWDWCERCGHGGHKGCLSDFWEDSEDGACPNEGCTCDCMPGRRRQGIHAALEEEWMKQPGAVTKAGRGILQGGTGGPQTMAAAGRRASGAKKSVKFAVQENE